MCLPKIEAHDVHVVVTKSEQASHFDAALWLVGAQRRPLVLDLRPWMEQLRHGRSVPGLFPPVDADPMPFVQSLVTALELVSIRLMNQEKEA
jgi:hypothetical protein